MSSTNNAWLVTLALLSSFAPAARPAGNEEFENLANGLKRGDVLILHGGTYTQTCRRAITVNGTAANPITIRAADGEAPIVTRPQLGSSTSGRLRPRF
jgi:hypothetical protein